MLFKQNSQSGQQGSTAKSAAMTTESVAPAKPMMSAAMPSADAGLKRPAAAMPADMADSGKRLIVEGQVEVTLKATRMLEIKPTGHFTGSCEVEEADVSGVYDGNLTVRGRLIVHAGGRVTGDISYGEIELERGAQITGKLSVRDRASHSSTERNEGRRNAA